MSNVHPWKLLSSELLELQLGQIDLLLAMYPDEVVIEEHSQIVLDRLRQIADGEEVVTFTTAPTISISLQLPIDSVTMDTRSLRLDLSVPFIQSENSNPGTSPSVKVRIQQPSWLSKAATVQLMSEVSDDDDLLGTIEQIKEAAAEQLQVTSSSDAAAIDTVVTHPLVRVWFYFPSISTRSKRDDFIKYAPSYDLTGFLYAGKPGLLCVEGVSQRIDDYMKFIKTESWGDIPAHHKKVSERYRENIVERVFPEMTETTDMVGERRGQRANRGDMKAMEEWLVERGLGEAFTKVLM